MAAGRPSALASAYANFSRTIDAYCAQYGADQPELAAKARDLDPLDDAKMLDRTLRTQRGGVHIGDQALIIGKIERIAENSPELRARLDTVGRDDWPRLFALAADHPELDQILTESHHIAADQRGEDVVILGPDVSLLEAMFRYVHGVVHLDQGHSMT